MKLASPQRAHRDERAHRDAELEWLNPPLFSLAVLAAAALVALLRSGAPRACSRADFDADVSALRLALAAAAAEDAAESAGGRTVPAGSVASPSLSTPPTLLLLSLNWREDAAWLGHWLAAAARRLRRVPFAVALSARSAAHAEALRAAAAAAAPGVKLFLSEPFVKDDVGPFLLEGHRRNIALAFARGLQFSHAMLLASNAAFVRDIAADGNADGEASAGAGAGAAAAVKNASAGVDAGSAAAEAGAVVGLSAFARSHPAVFSSILGDGWHWARGVRADSCLHVWRRAADAAVACEAGAVCAQDAAAPGLGAGEHLLFAGVSEGFIAPRRAWRRLLPLVEAYSRLSLLMTPAPSFAAVRGLNSASAYPGEEVVLATAAALLGARVPGLEGAFAHAVRAYFEFGREPHFTPTAAELRDEMRREGGALAVKRVPRDAEHLLWRIAAGNGR
jgi:hypothetical protein